MASDTIAAIATPPGAGGIGVVRISGPDARRIAEAVAGQIPPPRASRLAGFRDSAGALIDRGMLLCFAGPASYTGEDVVEFQSHGSMPVLHSVLARCVELGARHARPGEFTERAFRNGKLDLAQAEAVADLIASRSIRAARSAQRALAGEFSHRIADIVARLTTLRAETEASIDFPDDMPASAASLPAVQTVREALHALLAATRHGARLASGARAVIIGEPNVGKSTLLNALAGMPRAIVSPQAGTTRDVIEVELNIAGILLRMSDTAGLRTTTDALEREGIARARAAIDLADIILLVVDDADLRAPAARLVPTDQACCEGKPIIVVHNKCDLYGVAPGTVQAGEPVHVFIAARDGLGIQTLNDALAALLDTESHEDNEFSARARHVDAVREAATLLDHIDGAMLLRAPEIAADIYRLAAQALDTITGRTTSEDLLGEIFARFCIGK